MTFGCSTSGTAAGPNGDGILTTVQFSTVSDGTSALTLSGVAMTDTASLPITLTATDGSITFVSPTATQTPANTNTPTQTSTPLPPTATPNQWGSTIAGPVPTL